MMEKSKEARAWEQEYRQLLSEAKFHEKEQKRAYYRGDFKASVSHRSQETSAYRRLDVLKAKKPKDATI